MTSDRSSLVDVRDPRVAAAVQRYWRKNIQIMTGLLSIWAFAGLGCGVLMAIVAVLIHTAVDFKKPGHPPALHFPKRVLAVSIMALLVKSKISTLESRSW